MIKDLIKSRELTQKKNSPLTLESKLLNYDEQRHNAVLFDLGMARSLNKRNAALEVEDSISKLNVTTQYGSYTREDINKICRKYSYQLQSTSDYNDSILSSEELLEVTNTVREHLDLVEGGYNEYIARNNFYMLAPSTHFLTSQKRFKLGEKDAPYMLFYKPDANKEYYVLLKHKETEYPIFRSIVGFTRTSPLHKAGVLTFTSMLLTSPIVFGLVSGNTTLALFIIGIVSFLVGLLSIIE